MIDRKTLKQRVLKILENHKGKDNPILMENVAVQAMEIFIIPGIKYNQSRVIRSVIRQLRFEGVPIGSVGGKNGGYFLATTQKEMNDIADLAYKRALSSLQLVRELRRINVGELLQQLEIELNNDKGEV